MIATFFVVFLTFCILMFAEYLSRSKEIHAELTRKLVHVLVGTFVAFWPFFLGWRQIELLSLAFFVVVSISIKLNIFRSIHAVERNITGELLFAIAVGMLALICTNKWIFMASMLHLSLADGVAAIVGLGWGDNNGYSIFGSAKSRAGTIGFFVTSVMIMVFYLLFSGSSNSIAMLAVVPIAATVAENIAVRGTDNLVMPLLVALILGTGK
jgi:dolichol kinase